MGHFQETTWPPLGSSRTYQPGEMPLPTKLRPRLRRMHQELSSEAASCSSQLRAAMPLKRARVNEKVQTNETIKALNETKEELEWVKKTWLRTEEDRRPEEPMEQDPDEAGKDDDKASTGGVSSLDFVFLDDYVIGTETLEGTTEPAKDETSTMEPPSAFMNFNRN